MSSKILAGRYELFEKIGEGGMSVVYKARCRLLNRYVAIKILKPEFIKDSKFTESFRREAQAAAGLSHPNIVNIYDVGKEGNIHYIVMELIEGKVLSDIIKEEGAMPYKRAIDIVKQIAGALEFAHKNNIIHRDVKPQNILITTTGIAKITDFGIAKAITETTIVDNSGGGVMGSVHYFSPEQARGGYVDAKSDIYSLGIVLYELLTGRVPFDGDNPVSVALMHINQPITPPSQLVDGIPPGLEQIVLKATDKYQVNRYASAQEMIDALDNIEFVTRVVGDSVFAAAAEEKPKETFDETAYADEVEEAKEEPVRKPTSVSKAKANKKKKIIIAVIAAIVVIGGLVAIGFATGILGGDGSRVPDLTDLTYEDAKIEAEDAGFKVKKGDEVFDDEIKSGKVVSQDPKADTKAKEGTYITVNISKGQGSEAVPNVVGMDVDKAETTLNENGFELGTITKEASDKPKDEVIKQTPGAGETASGGSKVDVVVSDGSKEGKAVVPYLIGKDLDTAESALSNAGLKLGKVTYEYSDDYDKGQVMWQQYEANSSIDKDTSVKIKISKGAASKDGSVDIYVDYGKAENDVFYLTVTVSDDNGTRNVISGKQRAKSDGGETVHVNGAGKGTVIVIFDSEEIMRKSVNFATGSVS